MNLSHTFQSVAMLALVAGCAVYSGWTLMPAGPRRKLALRLAGMRWIGRLPAVARAARPCAGACGCEGCDRFDETSPAAPASRGGNAHESVVKVVQRRPVR